MHLNLLITLVTRESASNREERFSVSKQLFTRYELKYLITFDTYRTLADTLIPYMQYDPFGDKQGRYSIFSLYFDSPDRKIYYETMNRAAFRQKLRLRIYNSASIDDSAYFEVKQKFKNVVNKRRTAIQLSDAYRFIEKRADVSDLENYSASNKQVLKEIRSFRDVYRLAPAVIVGYDRQAFHGIDDTDLRITFDYHLTCRNDNYRLENGMHNGAYFVPPNLVVLEVKVKHSVPLWLTKLLSEFRCPLRSVSKFCTSVDCVSPDNHGSESRRNSIILGGDQDGSILGAV
jgi:hypothetical protein